jgi:hypothetical protein
MAETTVLPFRNDKRQPLDDRDFPIIGSAWHTRTGANVFVSDVYQCNGQTHITFMSERGHSVHCHLADLGTIFLKGYV